MAAANINQSFNIVRMQNECRLCAIDLPLRPVIDGENTFCCHGCHVVYNLLLSKNQLENATENSIFLQALKSGLISNPSLIEQIQKQRQELNDGEKEKLYIEVGEMWCPSCAEVIRLMLLKQQGVLTCIVDYTTDLAAIEFSPRYLSKEQIFNIIKNLGYQPIGLDDQKDQAISFSLTLRFIIATFCSLNIMMLAYPLYTTYFNYDGEGYGNLFAWTSWGFSLPVISYCAWPIWRRFLGSLQLGLLGMETLVALGIAAAFSLSFAELLLGSNQVYFDSMSVIITFVLLGKIIETKAKFSAKDSLKRLYRSTPRRGRKLFPDGSQQFVPIKEVHKDDILVVYSGELISADGIVLSGEGSCDESLMTGEAIPIVKTEGKKVIGGTILLQGHLHYRVLSGIEETALYKIIEIIEKDIGHKSAYLRAADKIVRWFVPLVISIALAAAFFCIQFEASTEHPYREALLRAIAVLLISCPCAIGIAAPTAESQLLNKLAELGAIVRNRGCLKHLGNESVFIFDKTGTSTEGCFSVISGLEQLSPKDLAALGSLAAQSIHPIALAISVEVSSKSAPAVDFEQMEEIAGHGIKGRTMGIDYSLGSARFLQLQGMAPCQEACFESSGKESAPVLSHAFFTKDGKCLAKITLGDRLRPHLKKNLAEMNNVKKILLSGDAEAPVAAVARAGGFDEWRSGCSPLEKRDFIESLRKQGEIVCMIGDGINDAPALTAAHVGISMPSATDMSIQVSDILLTTERLEILKKIRILSLKGQKLIHQNLFWAFFYNIIGIFLAAFGALSPIFAAFAMSVSSLTVLLNARRL